MPDTKITALAAITTVDPAADVLPIVDISDTSMAASGTTKKITSNQILGAGGTATLASATISGDLTVDTSTLKVDSANNRVGIGTASPLFPLDIISSGATTVAVRSTGAVGLFRGYAITDGTTEYGQFKQSLSSGELQIVSGNAGWGGFLTISTGGSERYRIASDGIATWSNVGGVAGTAMTLNATGLGVGVTPAGTGGCLQLKSGITFPATQVASSDANTLDDYEEGTFTPTVIGTTTAGTGTYTNQVGRYTKIGNLVTIQVYLSWTAHTGTGNMRFGNFPFNTASDAGSLSAAAIGYVNNIALTAGNILTAFTSVSNSFIAVYQTPVGGGASTEVPIDTSGDIVFTLTYRA